MDSVDIQFALVDARLQSCLGVNGGGKDWIDLILKVSDGHYFYDESRRPLNAGHWDISLHRGALSDDLDDGMVGSISYELIYGGVCKGRVGLAEQQFDRLFQAMLSGKRVRHIAMKVCGFAETGSTLIWPRAGTVDLPIELFVITHVLFEEAQD